MRETLSRRSFLQACLVWGMSARGPLRPTRLLALCHPLANRAAGRERAGHAASPAPGVQPLLRLRVVSLNVWALPLVSKDTPARLAAIGRRLGELKADIVGLQEVWLEDARQRILAEVREAGDLRHHTYLGTGLRESGLLILSRFPIQEVGFHRFQLSSQPERVAEAEYIAGKGIGYVRVDTPAGALDIYNFHLIAQYTTDEQDPYRAHRAAAAYEMMQFIADQTHERHPVLLMGDLNTRPDQLGYRLVSCIGGFRDTYRAAHPESAGYTRSGLNPYTPDEEPKRIDYIFSKDGAAVGCATVASEVIMEENPPARDGIALAAYSDHYGVLSEIELVSGRSAGDATEVTCASTGAIWGEFHASVEAALQEARTRQTHHYGKGLGSAVVGPALYFYGRTLQTPVAATTASTTREPPVQTGARPEGPGRRRSAMLRRRTFLARLMQATATVGIAPYAILQGWLGLSVVPTEIQGLEALRAEIEVQRGTGHGGR